MDRRGSSPLEERRCRMSTTQLALQEATGVQQSLISSMEHGREPLTYNVAKSLGSYLDIDPFQLVLEDSFWLMTNGQASFESCENFGQVVAKHLLRLPESKQLRGLQFACNVGRASLTIGGSITNQIMVESVQCAPSILLNEKETQYQLAANAELGAKSQARRDAEGFGYIEPPAILGRDKQAFEIEGKLAQRPGALIPVAPPLTTAQQSIEHVGSAPPVLLAKPKGGKGK